MMVRTPRLPMIGYFGDFGFSTTERSAEIALRQVIEFCRTLRIPLKDRNSAVGVAITYLHMGSVSPSHSNGVTSGVPLSPEKAM